jgi:hypothetical protein
MREEVVRPERFELPTPWFVARCSIQLSYGRAGGAARVFSGRLKRRHFSMLACFNKTAPLDGKTAIFRLS